MILKKQNVKWMIIAYFTVCITLAWGLYEYFSTSELNSFLGSFVGGALGGLGTLLTLHFTVGSTYDIIAESRRNERKKFTDSIAEDLGKFITYVSDYRYCDMREATLTKDLNVSKTRLAEIENKLMEINEQQKNICSIDSDTILKYSYMEQKVEKEKDREYRTYQELLQKTQKCAENESGLNMNAIYYTLLNKLNGVASANLLLAEVKNIRKQARTDKVDPMELRGCLTEKTEELQTLFTQFAEDYVNGK